MSTSSLLTATIAAFSSFTDHPSHPTNLTTCCAVLTFSPSQWKLSAMRLQALLVASLLWHFSIRSRTYERDSKCKSSSERNN